MFKQEHVLSTSYSFKPPSSPGRASSLILHGDAVQTRLGASGVDAFVHHVLWQNGKIGG